MIVAVQNRRIAHQMTDVTDEQQGAAVQHKLTGAIGLGVFAIRVQTTGERLAALTHFLGEGALQNA